MGSMPSMPSLESTAVQAAISAAPRAQFNPTARGRACRTECQNAATVWPDNRRPEASVTVPLMITGSRSPVCSMSSSKANSAALASVTGFGNSPSVPATPLALVRAAFART